MPVVRVPSLLRPLAGGASEITASGATLGDVLDDVGRRFPDLRDRILDAGVARRDIVFAVGPDEVRDLDAPVPADAEVHILPSIAGGSGHGSEPLRALVAEDTYAWRYAIVELLEGAGYHCVAVEDGEAAALLLADPGHAFDIAITDFRMPRGSGWRVIEAARTHRGASFPVIMQTAESQYSDVHIRAAELKVPVLAKDHLLRTLLPAIEKALQSR